MREEWSGGGRSGVWGLYRHRTGCGGVVSVKELFVVMLLVAVVRRLRLGVLRGCVEMGGGSERGMMCWERAEVIVVSTGDALDGH